MGVRLRRPFHPKALFGRAGNFGEVPIAGTAQKQSTNVASRLLHLLSIKCEPKWYSNWQRLNCQDRIGDEMKKLLQLFLLALPALLFVLMLEWASGIYLNSRFDDFNLAVQGGGEMPANGYQLWAHPANYSNWLRVSRYNNFGFRSFDDTSVEKPQDTVRIFIMGGSTALGAGANPTYPWVNMSGQGQYAPDETIAASLERLLNAKYPSRTYEVINAATNWTQLHQQIIHYLRKVQYFDPDLVISIDGMNDVLPIADSYLSTWDQSEKEKVDILQSNFRVKLQPLLKSSNFVYLAAGATFGEKRQGRLPIDQELVNRYAAMSKPEGFNANAEKYLVTNAELVNRGVEFYIDHLWHFSDILRRDKVASLFVQQPALIMDQTKQLTKIEIALKNYLYATEAYYDVNFFQQLEKEASATARAEGLEFVSFLNIFGAETTEIYTDYCHLTPYGNEVFANELVNEIEARYPHLFTGEVAARIN